MKHIDSTRALLFAATLVLVLPGTGAAQGVLEIPQPGAVRSGIGIVSGWNCDADRIDVVFDTFDPLQAAYGTERNDTFASCGDADNGYSLLFNWNILGAGPHTVRVLRNGVEFASANITVTTFGVEFLTGAGGSAVAEGFPSGTANAELVWRQDSQTFEINQINVAACPPDMVRAGSVCVDTYEASVWSDAAGTGTQYGIVSDDYPCADNGGDCPGAIFAISRAGVAPARFATWAQAAEACANVGKRLLRNSEWQVAATGTPDPTGAPGPTECNTDSPGPVTTGSRTACVSTRGAFDMVGNLLEWVADWVPQSTNLAPPLFGGDDINAFAGASTTGGPAALLRGGSYVNFLAGGTGAGVFNVIGTAVVSDSEATIGFRCGR